MICERCEQEFAGARCVCGWSAPTEALRGGPTLRLNPCDVPGCGRIVSAGDPEKNLTQGRHLPVRCRFHRNPAYTDPPKPASMPSLPDPGPFVPFEEVREEFARIRAASGRALRAYWAEQGITVRPPAPLPSGWSAVRTELRRLADRWFPPIP